MVPPSSGLPSIPLSMLPPEIQNNFSVKPLRCYLQEVHYLAILECPPKVEAVRGRKTLDSISTTDQGLKEIQNISYLINLRLLGCFSLAPVESYLFSAFQSIAYAYI